MLHYSSLPLSDDIVDCVLCFLSSFEALPATILTSKAFLRVFNAHKTTIVREICLNIIGHLLPCALRLVRFEVENEDSLFNGKHDWLKIPEVGSETDQLGKVTKEQIKLLLKYLSDIRKLEDFFSFNYKDMSSPSSLLTSAESFRFHRAMYRVALFTRLFPVSVYQRDFTGAEVRAVKKIQKGFLQEFNIQELQEIYAVCEFLSLLVSHTSESNGIGDHVPSWVNRALISTGLDTILKLYEMQRSDLIPLPLSGPWGTVDDIDAGVWLNPLNGYLYDPLREILEAQQAVLNSEKYPRAILDSLEDGPAQCSNCESDLLKSHYWTRTNWSALKYGFDDFGTLRYPERFLKGRLLENETEWPFYASVFDIEKFDYAGLMHGLFEVKLDRFEKWKPEDWLCSTCVATFISDNLHHLLWRLHEEEWEKPGDPTRYNCMDGYDCKLQVKYPHHARENNHFFDPKRIVTPRMKGRFQDDPEVIAFMSDWPEWEDEYSEESEGPDGSEGLEDGSEDAEDE